MLQVNWPVITIHPYSNKFATGELKLDDSPDLSAGQVPVITIGWYLYWQSVDIKADTWSIYMLRESRLRVSRHVIHWQVSSKTVSWHLADTSTDMLWIQQSLVYQLTVIMVVSVITVVLCTGGGVFIVYAHMLTERHAAPTAVILNAT